MEKITTKEELKQRIKELMSLEIKAKNSYEDDILTFKNFKIKNTIYQIKKDEERHIALLEKIIKILE
jgi:hypothetical protein